VTLAVRLVAVCALACAPGLTAPRAAEAPTPAAAVAAFRQSPVQSALALQRAAAAHPLVAPALDLLQAEAQLGAGAADKARVLALRAAKALPALSPRAHLVAARAALANRPPDCAAALVFLDKAPPTPRWVPADEALGLRWRAEAACGRREAQATRRRLALEWPEARLGREAGQGLDLTPEERLKQGEALENARAYPAAEQIYSGLLGGPQADEARLRIGKLHLERMRDDFTIAERAFAEVAAGTSPQAVEAAYLRARALGRAGDLPAAAAAYDRFLERYPTAPQVPDARFFRVFLDYEAGRFGAAATGFAALTNAGPWSAAARWYHAFSLYLDHSPGAVAALQAVHAQEKRDKNPTAARRAAYWAAKAVAREDAARGRSMLLALADEAPLDWYGLLVRRAYPGALRPVPALPREKRPAAVPAPRAHAETAARIRALADAGLSDVARRVLAEVWPALRGAGLWSLQADLARTAEDFGRLYRGAHVRHRSVLDGVPRPAEAQAWRDAYPMGWPTHLKSAAAEGLRPSHLAAFILKESAFDPDAVSPAHAMGLMQLMDYTARNILAHRGEEDRPVPDLFEPAENIALGGWYLGALARRFGGQLPLVAAAYNAGPPSVLSWYRGRTTVETDLFVENIPFRETRDYVKKLVSLHAIFQLVHEGRPLDEAAASLPPMLDLTVRPGVDF
jgi:soluble lytic murein transglycosylase